MQIEQFDILDKYGEPTGNTAHKGAALSDGQYYLGVHAYIHNSKGEFLLQQRSFDKDFLPGGWDIHMGHVFAGETSVGGIIREIQEEIGLVAPKDNVRFVRRVFWEAFYHIFDIYFLDIEFNIDMLPLQAGEVVNVKLASKREMINLVSRMDYRPDEYRKIVLEEINNLNSSN